MRRFSRLMAAVPLILMAAVAPAQEPGTGQLLVSSTALSDPNFSETVLLIVHHGQDGSLAVALNRPTWVDPQDAFPEVPALNAYSNRLFFGGPNAPDQLLVVFESDDTQMQNARRVLDRVYVSVDPAILEDLDPLAESPLRVRLFAGHSAWNPGQLEAEIAAGNWRVLPADSGQVFDANPSDLWQRQPLGIGGVTAALR